MSSARSSRLLAAVLAATLLAGCARREAGGTAAVDTEVMAYLSEARALHHEANLKEETGDLGGAAEAMKRLIAARKPHPERPSPEVEEVLADAFARLAEVELRRGELDRAADAVRGGLDHAPDTTYFRGHLLEVEGLVEETRAARFADAGKPEDATRARARALELLEEVVRIQDQVIQRSVSKRDAEAPR